MTAAFASGAGGQELDFLVSPGALSEAHAELGGLRNCVSCHTPGQGAAEAKCLACHQDLARRIQMGRGFHRDKADACFTCHPEHQGGEIQLLAFNPETFDHSQTGYPLAGRHLQVEQCTDCHRLDNAPRREKTRSWLVNDTRCIACHEDAHRGQLGEDCLHCHAVETPFDEIRFVHDRTAFPLQGAHRRVACERCHADQKWKGLRFSTCTDCHEDRHRPSLGSDCTRCHDNTSWKVGTFNHGRTRYPLLGRHIEVDCAQCHRTGTFRNVAFGQCTNCHLNDPHRGQFSVDCSSCHSVDGFRPVVFDHARSRYPLTEKHTSVVCDKCHAREEGGFPAGLAEAVRYKPLSTLCRDCHDDVHLGQFQKNCDTCHTSAGFGLRQLVFRHDVHSRYELAGKHAALSCDPCHKPERASFPAGDGLAVRYRPLPDRCGGCHPNVHDPRGAGEGTTSGADCGGCHTTESFRSTSFDHGRTSFPLDGKHTSLTCERCHELVPAADRRVVSFQQMDRDCIDCHRNPHSSRQRQCMECHSTSTWRVRAW